MASLTDQLRDHREPTLLLYLANELSAPDRMQLERMLAADPSLRHDLESLRSLQDQVLANLADLDSNDPLHASEDLSTRRVMREMRRVHLEMKSRAPVQLEASTLRHWPRWTYPVAAAVAVIFILLGLWGFGVIDFTPAMPGPRQPDRADYEDYMNPNLADMSQQERTQSILLASFGGPEELDHPLELEESEDPGALRNNG